VLEDEQPHQERARRQGDEEGERPVAGGGAPEGGGRQEQVRSESVEELPDRPGRSRLAVGGAVARDLARERRDVLAARIDEARSRGGGRGRGSGGVYGVFLCP
jgi:hypothetical protein